MPGGNGREHGISRAPKRETEADTIKKPPPTPKNPVTKPTTKRSERMSPEKRSVSADEATKSIPK